jgi:hypothetical protein
MVAIGAARLVKEGALGIEHGALLLALVEQVDDAAASDDGRRWRERSVQGQVLLAMQDLVVVAVGSSLSSVMGEHHRHGRQRHKTPLVHELEIGVIAAIGTAAKA